MAKVPRIGCCITPHGFGHAARAAAVMEAVGEQVQAEFVVGTTVPEWFFFDSLSRPFSYQALPTDIGLVQKNSMQEDLHATLRELDDFYPLSEERVARAVQLFSGCDLILCDIAPLGIVAAARLGIPSVLLENFTWDWIYSGYLADFPDLRAHIDYLRSVYSQATLHLQTDPVCRPAAGLRVTAPISRAAGQSRAEVRRRLRVGREKLVLLTMGGVKGNTYAIAPLVQKKDTVFILGGRGKEDEFSGNIRWIAKQSDFFHPDLVVASDLVVGKAGYSTLAEVYSAGVPFAYICRKTFPESAILADFIDRKMRGTELAEADLLSGTWIRRLDELTARQPENRSRENGALFAAEAIVDLLRSRYPVPDISKLKTRNLK